MKTEERAMFANANGITEGQLTAIEPLIDELIRQARESADIEYIQIPFHAAVQLLAVAKLREWIEWRPGHVRCPECQIEFQAVPVTERHHHRECRVAGLIKLLIDKTTAPGREQSHAVSPDATSTTR